MFLDISMIYFLYFNHLFFERRRFKENNNSWINYFDFITIFYNTQYANILEFSLNKFIIVFIIPFTSILETPLLESSCTLVFSFLPTELNRVL
jgi:hypothetical protein